MTKLFALLAAFGIAISAPAFAAENQPVAEAAPTAAVKEAAPSAGDATPIVAEKKTHRHVDKKKKVSAHKTKTAEPKAN